MALVRNLYETIDISLFSLFDIFFFTKYHVPGQPQRYTRGFLIGELLELNLV